MRLIYYLKIIVFTCLLSVNCTAKTSPQTNTYGKRTYDILIPDGDTVKPAPTVFLLHGGGGTGERLRKHFDLSSRAADAGVVLVYPYGLDGHWNDGRPNKMKNGRKIFKADVPDDVTFLKGLANDLIKRGVSKKGHIYIAGVSNGGMMTQRILCEASDTFVAGASIIAGLPKALENCEPLHPRPILLINGDADPLMPWQGGGVGFRKKRGLVLSGLDTFAHWRKINSCGSKYTTQPMANIYPKDQTLPVRYKTSCQQATEMIRIQNGGHYIPMPISTYRPNSRKYKRTKKWLGAYNHDIDSRAEIWNFFFGGK